MAGAIREQNPLLIPRVKIRVCVACIMPGKWSFDCRKRPTFYCPNCGFRVFIYTARSLIGFEMLHELVMRTNPARQRQLLDRVVNARVKAATG